MSFLHYARCKGICSLVFLVITLGTTARDLLLICGACPHLRPIAKEKT